VANYPRPAAEDPLLRLHVAADNAAMSEPPTAILTVRIATEDDEAAARSLARRAFAELRRLYETKFSAAAAGSPGILIVAEIGRWIVGTVRYEIEAHRLHLHELAVGACQRRTGVGRALVQHCSGIAAANPLFPARSPCWP
jgi:ribosomal protein S18 acetylase RimI-like enzyme